MKSAFLSTPSAPRMAHVGCLRRSSLHHRAQAPLQPRPLTANRRQQVARTPTTARLQLPSAQRLLSDAGTALLGSLRRRAAQLTVLGASSAGLVLVLSHAQQGDLVAEIAEKAAGRPESVSLETWLACLALSSVGRVLAYSGIGLLIARHFDRRVAASDNVLAVVHARQATLRRFSQAVLGELAGQGQGREGAGASSAADAERAAMFRDWFEEQLEMQDLVLSKISHPSLDPHERMLRQLGGATPAGLEPYDSSNDEDDDAIMLDWEDPEAPSRRIKGPGHKGSSGPYARLRLDRSLNSMGGSAFNGGRPRQRGGYRGRSAREGGGAWDLEEARVRLERLLSVRSPSEQWQRDAAHHALFMAHLREMRRRLERVLGLPAEGGGGGGEGNGGSGQ